MLRGATLRASAMVGTAVLRIVVSRASMKKATAISQGRNCLTGEGVWATWGCIRSRAFDSIVASGVACATLRRVVWVRFAKFVLGLGWGGRLFHFGNLGSFRRFVLSWVEQRDGELSALEEVCSILRLGFVSHSLYFFAFRGRLPIGRRLPACTTLGWLAG